MLEYSNIVLEIHNIILEKYNITREIMKSNLRTILIVVVAVLVVATFVLWISNSDVSFDFGTILMFVIPVIILVYAVLFVRKRLTDARDRMPAEDELTKMIRLRSGYTSFQISLFLWLVIGSVEDRVDLEGHTIIGAGILGMAIIFALSWMYHRYIRRSHD
jgi:peptidoglycan/LPS O-acetylase OafA/YrhL